MALENRKPTKSNLFMNMFSLGMIRFPARAAKAIVAGSITTGEPSHRSNVDGN